MFSTAFKCTIDQDYNYIVDEKGNAFIRLAKIKWGESEEYKLDIRKWYNTKGEERMNKGFSFLTDEGPNELVKILSETGYGRTIDILKGISTREDFRSSLNKVLSGDDEFYDTSIKDEEYYDPKEALL